MTAVGGAETVDRLGLLASAIAGRTVEVAEAQPGECPWTDGTVVFVDDEASSWDQVRAVAVQASLLAAGSLAPDVLGGLGRRGPTGQRYLAVEGHRALAAQETVLPGVVRGLIDRATAARSGSPAASLALAASRELIPDAPEVFGAIRPRRVRAAPAAGQGDGEGDGGDQHVPRRASEQVLRELEDGEDADGATGFDLFHPVGGGGAVGRLLRRLLGSARNRSGGGQPGADAPTHRTTSGHRVARRAALSVATGALPDDPEAGRGRGAVYPEWNVHARRYRAAWCTVGEVEPEGKGGEPLVPPDTHALRRPLARLGLELERRRRQPDGDDIDIDALVEARVELAAGSAPDEAVYIDTVRGRRDLSVLVLLDVSGSAGEPSPTGERVHEHQRAAAAALTLALHDLGDRVALYGFRSLGRQAVQVLPVKRFGDRLDARALGRLASLEPAAYTRLGAAIRHGAAVLEAEGGTARRLLVVLSDGFAYDHGYGGAYGEADARRALSEARRRGTACLCLSIAAGTDIRALRRVFGTAAHASLPHAGVLPMTVGPLFRSALRRAEAQRRVSQPRERARARLRIEESTR
jgi:nitric oxide reductase NorD protein